VPLKIRMAENDDYLISTKSLPRTIVCPYCQSRFQTTAEMSKHIGIFRNIRKHIALLTDGTVMFERTLLMNYTSGPWQAFMLSC